MNEDFAPFELAVKLKEKGFDEPCFGWYYPSEVCGFDYKTTVVFNNGEYRGCNYKDMLVSHKDEKHIDAPTIPQVLKWLREEKRIDAGAVWDNRDGKWIGYINEMDMPDLVGEYVLHNTYDTYEQAAVAGIEYVLEKSL